MELSIYNIIRGPWVTTKAYAINRDFRKLVLAIHPMANKPMVVEALKKLFNVTPEDVRIIVCKPKSRRVGRMVVMGKKRKKAIVTLSEGDAVNLGVDTPAVYEAGAEHRSQEQK